MRFYTANFTFDLRKSDLVFESSLNCRLVVKVLLNNIILEFLYASLFILMTMCTFYVWLSTVYNMYDGF